ncbi:hypothetical protein SAMN04488109_5161 [Chryseolinea serpens]|uniref:Uncharacterized protein n=1 Tax=Chryseolinea serpens TaxID=947013 RepID=A0A1M5VJU9_9BACT|nr:hypothetical protein [Chryseolinea serpens]SHH75468.1 hypothetical protein SAMN04488109_5161 [Chryseolinea serpens]
MGIYLENSQLITYLRLGKTIEQWLGTTKEQEETIIKWLSIASEKDGTYRVTYHEVFDEGSEDLLDIYDFSVPDPDLEFGESDSFATYEEALEFSRQKYGCRDDKFVTAGQIQEEYRLYLLSRSE